MFRNKCTNWYAIQMRVSIVIRNSWDGWVLRKIGQNLVSALNTLGVDAEYANSPNPDSDINHFMHFGFADGVQGSMTTMMITHVDDRIKAKRVKKLLSEQIDGGICMSRYHMEELISYGVGPEKLSYVLPALDNTLVRRIHFTIQCNCYRDGRKNESFLENLARDVDLSFAEFSFYGTGWEVMATILELSGARVSIILPTDDFSKDYTEMRNALAAADYYVNLGWDEGSLGSLDAFVNRTGMILSAQGYHLNIPDERIQFFNDYKEFFNLIVEIRSNYNLRQLAASNMSWSQYARNHISIWETLLGEGALGKPTNSTYGEGSLEFDRTKLNPILDLSFRKTIRRARGILVRKIGLGNK